MAKILRLELDVLKPNNLSIIDIGSQLTSATGVVDVDILVKEVEREVEKIRIIINGKGISFENVMKIIDALGCAVHSVDRVVTQKR